MCLTVLTLVGYRIIRLRRAAGAHVPEACPADGPDPGRLRPSLRIGWLCCR
ncbi:MAG TPA: hypothetical protein VG713_18870 [Pirellulales bacterium]|nr:hypothetical protein [Pirellulales bacterium]